MLGVVALLYVTDLGKNPLDVSLDNSWVAVIGWAAHNHLQFGRDIIFTYGPLGYVLYPVSLPLIYWPALALKTAINIFLLFTVFVLSARLHPVRRILLILTTVLAAFYSPLAAYMFLIVCAVFLVFWQKPSSRPLQIAGVAFLALTFLFKGTHLLLMLPLMVVGCAYLLWRRDNRSLLLIVSSFLIALVAAWILAGQKLTNLPAYFGWMLEVAQAYSEAMSRPPTNSVLAAGLIGLAFLTAQIVIAFVCDRSQPRAWFVSVAHGMALFVVWKMSYTRADGHTPQLFYYGVPMALALPMFYDRRRTLSAAFDYSTIFVVIVCGLFVIHDRTHLTVTAALRHARTRLTSNLRALTAPTQLRLKAQSAYEAEKNKFMLPQIRAIVGRSTVDVFGFQQAIAILNDFNYTPRPVFQGYCVTSTPLMKVNSDFYRSARSPQYVLFKLQTIEARIPAMDDAEALLVLVQNYEPVLVENGYTLLRRKATTPATEFRPIASGEARLLDRIPVPNGTIWCRLKVRKTLFGRLVNFFYQLPELQVITDRSGTSALRKNRIISSATENGFLMNPLLLTERDFVDLTKGNYDKAQIQSVRVLPPKRAKWLMRSRVQYEFSEIVLTGGNRDN